MKAKRRWLTAILVTSAKHAPGLPWQSSVRNYVPPLPGPVPHIPVAIHAPRPQANAAH